MNHRFTRTAMLIGEEGLQILKQSAVIVCGLGGVGSYIAESLARSGVGRLRLVDFDTVDITNLNRQLPALTSTLGQYKTEIMSARLLDINPELDVDIISEKVSSETIEQVLAGQWDFTADAIDDVGAKILLIEECRAKAIPIITSMGAGNKLDPTQVRVADISKTHGCPLAKAIRRRLREDGISSGVVTVFSPECAPETKISGRTPASMSFVPGTFGLTMASAIIRELIVPSEG